MKETHALLLSDQHGPIAVFSCDRSDTQKDGDYSLIVRDEILHPDIWDITELTLMIQGVDFKIDQKTRDVSPPGSVVHIEIGDASMPHDLKGTLVALAEPLKLIVRKKADSLGNNALVAISINDINHIVFFDASKQGIEYTGSVSADLLCLNGTDPISQTDSLGRIFSEFPTIGAACDYARAQFEIGLENISRFQNDLMNKKITNPKGPVTLNTIKGMSIFAEVSYPDLPSEKFIELVNEQIIKTVNRRFRVKALEEQHSRLKEQMNALEQEIAAQ